jgi:hypothetical protein
MMRVLSMRNKIFQLIFSNFLYLVLYQFQQEEKILWRIIWRQACYFYRRLQDRDKLFLYTMTVHGGDMVVN